MKQEKRNWHRLTEEETLRQLGSRNTGLSGKEASIRLRKSGSNPLFELSQGKPALLRRLLTDPTFLAFVLVSVLAACFSEFLSVALSRLIFGVWCLYIGWRLARVDRGRDLLRMCGIPTVTVQRNGKRLSVSAGKIVTGDVILLRQGDVVPADCRLLSASNLRVRFYNLECTDSKRAFLIQSKRSDVVYPYQTDVVAPDFENMIYAGSEIVLGRGRAVVVATGRETLLGARGERLCEDKFEKDARIISAMQPYFKLLGIATLVLLFPLSLIALLVSPQDQSGMRVFLPVFAWVTSMSAILPYCYVQIILHHGVRALFIKNTKESGAILKSTRSIDHLPHLTDLFLIGRAPLSDGQRHFEAAFAGDALLEGAALSPLCEAMCLLDDAKRKVPDIFSGDPIREDPCITEMISASEFDREALRLRTTGCELFRGEHEQILDVEGSSGQFRLRFYDGVPTLFGCLEYQRSDGKTAILDSQIRSEYQEFLVRAIDLGRSVVTVVKEIGGRVLLLGGVVVKEQALEDAAQTIARLEKKGVRICLFLDGKSRADQADAREWMPNPNAIYTAGEHVLAVGGEHSGAFFGYTRQEIAAYIRALKQAGRVVGVMTDSSELRSLYALASLGIACESDSDAFSGSECAPILRQESDVLVTRASAHGGGLRSVERAIDTLRTTTFAIHRFFELFFSLRILQTAFVALSIVAGIGLMPQIFLVYAIFFMDCILLMWICNGKRQGNAESAAVRQEKDLSAFFSKKSLWLSSMITPIGLVSILTILYRTDVISLGNCYGMILLGMLLMGTMILLSTETNVRIGKKKMLALALLWIPVLLVLIPSACFSIIGNLTELGAWSIAGVAALPALLVLCLFSFFILKKEFK